MDHALRPPNLPAPDPPRMIVWLDGKFLEESEATVPVTDRGFLYGDGLFESFAMHGGEPFLWADHLKRFLRSAEEIGIPVPAGEKELLTIARDLARRNALDRAVLRITLTRGSGPRGYSPKLAKSPLLLLAIYPLVPPAKDPRAWDLITCSLRVPSGYGVAAWKSTSKLLQVLARREAELGGADDALLLNSAGEIAECASANLFWVNGRTLLTPSLGTGCLPGVTRQWVISEAKCCDLEVAETRARDLCNAEGVFATLTGPGVVEVVKLDGVALPRSVVTRRLWERYQKALGRVANDAAKG